MSWADHFWKVGEICSSYVQKYILFDKEYEEKMKNLVAITCMLVDRYKVKVESGVLLVPTYTMSVNKHTDF